LVLTREANFDIGAAVVGLARLAVNKEAVERVGAAGLSAAGVAAATSVFAGAGDDFGLSETEVKDNGCAFASEPESLCSGLLSFNKSLVREDIGFQLVAAACSSYCPSGWVSSPFGIGLVNASIRLGWILDRCKEEFFPEYRQTDRFTWGKYVCVAINM